MVFTPHLVVCFCIWVCSLHNFYQFYFQGVNEWRQQSEESTRRSKDSSWEDEDTVENDIWEFGSIEISPIRNGSLETREEIVELKIVLSAESFIFFLLGRDALEWHSSWKLNSVIIVNWLCHFWRKGFNRFRVIVLFMFSNYGEIYFFAQAIINLTNWYFTGLVFSIFITCILAMPSLIFCIFLKIPNCWKQSLNSPNFEILLLGDDHWVF